MINNLGSKEQGGILKTEKQLLIEATQKIGEMENELRRAAQEVQMRDQAIEKLKWQTAQLRIGITAMGNYYNCPPEKAKELFDAYVEEQNTLLISKTEEAKKQFAQDLKDGKVPDLRVVDDAKEG